MNTFPTAEELKTILASRDGKLEETSFAKLLLALAVHKKTAVLELHRNALEKRITFDDGAPVECKSNIATEQIGRFMVSSGKLLERDYQAALMLSAAHGIPVEEAIVEKQLIAASELFKILQQNLGRKLLDAFSWDSGTWHISGDVPEHHSPLQVKAPQLLLTGILKLESQDVIDEAIEALGGKTIRIQRQGFFHVEDFRFSSEQNKVIDYLRNGTNVAQLTSSVQIVPEELNRFIYALLFLGNATSEVLSSKLELDIEEPEPKIAPAAPKPAPAAPAPVTPPPPRVEARPAPPPTPFMLEPEARPAAAVSVSNIGRDALMRAYLSFRRKDAFDLFELQENSTTDQINKAYVAFADQFLPSKFDGANGESLREKATEIFLFAARAYADLADLSRRQVLIERRTQKAAEPKEEVGETTATRKRLIDPEALYREGIMLFEVGKAKEALGYFQTAAECDAQNGHYAAELAYCRYHLLISTAAHTQKMLKNVLRIDPNCGTAHMYIGKIHAVLGNKLEAEGYLRKAAGLMPKDRRPLEALKALAASGSATRAR